VEKTSIISGMPDHISYHDTQK